MPLQRTTLAVLAGALFAAGCGTDVTTSADEARSLAAGSAAHASARDAGATASWNELATALADQTAIDQGRMYSYLSLAQLRAAELAANERGERRNFRSFRHQYRNRLDVSSAIAGASAVVLKAFFPASATAIDAALAQQVAAAQAQEKTHDDAAEAADLGADVGAAVMAYASGDGVGLTNPGTPPTGAGYWQWSGGPMVRGNYHARPFFIASGAELLPPPPPAFGSTEYLAALAEVRQVSDTRTSGQLAIATYWNLNQSGRRNAPFNNKAVELIRAYGLPDASAARLMFLMNAAMFDALVGCFDAKYLYWFVRPPQADPLITTPVGLPPHPSYPSAHSCVSGAMSGVLMAWFPKEAAALDAMAQEASISRLYAGIHYRFDMEAGVALGRKAAAKAVAADLATVAVLP